MTTEMEAQAEKDPCPSMESCRPTSSQEAEFVKRLFVQGSAKFVDLSLGQSSPSPEPDALATTSTLKSSDSANHQMVVFLSSNECCAEGSTKVRVSDLEAKRAGMVSGAELVAVEERTSLHSTGKRKYESKVDDLISRLKAGVKSGMGGSAKDVKRRGTSELNVKERGGLLEMLNEAKDLFGDSGEKLEEEDIMETAKKCGWSFPRARWWPKDGEDWSDELP